MGEREALMIALSVWEEVFGDPTVVVEALLIGLVLALVGAGGYVFFVFSMKDDRADKRLERYKNPWDRMSGEKEAQAPRSPQNRKAKVILLAVIGVLLILICLLLAISFGWI